MESNFTLLIFELASSSVIWVSDCVWAYGSPLRSCPPALLRVTSQAGVALCPGSPCSPPSPLSGHLTLSHFLLLRPISVGESLGVSALRPALSSLSAVSPRPSRVSLQSNQPSRRLTPSESCSLRSEPSLSQIRMGPPLFRRRNDSYNTSTASTTTAAVAVAASVDWALPRPRFLSPP